MTRAYRIVPGSNIEGLQLCQEEVAEPGPRQVKMRVRAVSLNYRDLMVAQGNGTISREAVIPCSDAAGEVIAVGADVTAFKLGDRVTGAFFPRWIKGPPAPEKIALAPGGNADGFLAEEQLLDEDAALAIPEHLDFCEAATLPCAGVTAWNALFVAGRLQRGDSVLLLGTGGVSMLALQLAKAAGLVAVVTSSSDEKLDRARSLGADHLINYRGFPDWHKEVRRLVDERGVGLVIEVGGEGTLKRSIAATRMGGMVVIVGGVSGFNATLDSLALVGGAKSLVGICVGSRAMFEDLNRFIAAARLHPPIDRTFQFSEAREAYTYLAAARHFGKVVVRVD